jgi:hypothetical protein
MKTVYRLAILGFLFAAGCTPDWFLHFDGPTTPSAAPTPQFSPRPAAPRNLVMPEQVDDHNAKEKAKALQQEIDLDAQDVLKMSAAPIAPEKR